MANKKNDDKQEVMIAGYLTDGRWEVGPKGACGKSSQKQHIKGAQDKENSRIIHYEGIVPHPYMHHMQTKLMGLLYKPPIIINGGL